MKAHYRGGLPLAPLLISVALHAGAVSGLVFRARALPFTGATPPGRAPIGVSVVGGDPVPAGGTPRRPPERSGSMAEIPPAHLVAVADATASGPHAPTPASNAAVASAPDDTTPAAAANLQEAYAAAVRERISANLRYPLGLRRRGITGHVELRLRLDAHGRIEQDAVAQSSGSSELDGLALEAARAAEPYPPPEGRQGAGPLVLSVPIEFRMRSQ